MQGLHGDLGLQIPHPSGYSKDKWTKPKAIASRKALCSSLGERGGLGDPRAVAGSNPLPPASASLGLSDASPTSCLLASPL